MQKQMKDRLVVNAFIQAYGKEQPPAGLIVHADVGITSLTADKTGISVTGGSTYKTLTKQYGANDIQDGYSLSYWTVDAYGTTSVLSLMQSSSATLYYGNIDYSTSASNKVYL